MRDDIIIRMAELNDAQAILNIYIYYIEETAITFEYTVPSVEEFKKRIQQTLSHYPYLVAEMDGEIVGYAYAGVFKARAAYDWDVETTVYVRQDMKKQGIGSKLYETLELHLKKQHITNLYACIGYPKVEDEYLTMDSEIFHEKMGYHTVGHFHDCGYKFDRWYDMIWMEKMIGDHESAQENVLSIEDIRRA